MSVTVLTGGVGGAKLVLGLTHVLPPRDIVAIVNTGDDFEHLGLHISPDVDTLLYTLSGRANRQQGWGREGESWAFMAALRELGGEDWFQLGDGDLALHILRSRRLRGGDTLSAVTQAFASAWQLETRILPMSDDRVRTVVTTDEGRLDFQHYFVARRCEPKVRSIEFDGADTALAAPGVIDAILSAETILIAPSNPFLSIDPILAVPSIRDALRATEAPVVAVSPIVDGAAVKGPTAKMMGELGLQVGNQPVADHYLGVIDALLIHTGDLPPHGIAYRQTDTLMRDADDRSRVAAAALQLAREVGRRSRP